MQVAGPTVTTTGTSSVYVAPDKVQLRFSVSDFDTDLNIAKRTSDEAAAHVIDFLHDQGIQREDVQTAQVSSNAIYDDRFEDGRHIRGNLKGYEVTRSYGVVVRDIAKFTDILDRLLTDKNVRVDGYAYESSQDRKYRDQARHDAAVAAREKATLLADTLGAHLGGVRTITENSVTPIFYAGAMANSLRDAGGGGASETATPIGQIEIRAEVTVTFDLAQGQ